LLKKYILLYLKMDTLLDDFTLIDILLVGYWVKLKVELIIYSSIFKISQDSPIKGEDYFL